MKIILSFFFYACILSTTSALSYNVNTYIPPKAYVYLPLVRGEVEKVMPETPSYGYFGALVEQESCISLTHKKCWDPSSQLKTSRELGIGLGMVTRAYNADGSLRFDKLTEMRNQYKDSLKEFSWLTVKERPDLQIRAMVLMTKDAYKSLWQVKSEMERLAMADAAYNGGLGGLRKERTACGLKANCDPQFWFKNIEHTCLKSKKALYGTRNACDINREHVTYALKVRLPKYESYFKSLKK